MSFRPFQEVNDPYLRRPPCGSINGFATAPAAAKLMGILANGGTHEGRTYLSPGTSRLLQERLTSGLEQLFQANLQFGRGTTPYKTPLVSMV